MLELQFWLMSIGFLLLGFAVGDKLYDYFPKKTKRNKLSIFIVPIILGGLVTSIPLLGLYGSPLAKGFIEEKFKVSPEILKKSSEEIDADIQKLKNMLKNTTNEIEKKQILNSIQMLEEQKKQIDKILFYNFNLFVACGLCVFTGSLVSIILRKRNEKNE